MASPPKLEPKPEPEAGLTDYERRREENIRRNDAILASIRREAAELSASFRIPSLKRPRRQQQPPQPRSTSPVVLRRSLRTRGIPPSASSASASPATPPSPPKPKSTRFSSALAASLRASADAADDDAAAPMTEDGFDAAKELVMRPADVRRVVPFRILSVRILPLADRTVVAAGNKLGHVGLWDVDGLVEEEEDGDGADRVFQYFPHGGPVGGIVAHPATPRKIYSCSYWGELCLMDVDKEIFDTIQIYRTACLWDLRRMKKKAPESLKVFKHNRTVHSAYFSPSGGMIATTSLDDTVRIFDLHNSASCILSHNNQTGRWLSTFKAVWSWNDTDLFIGNMKRAIDVISIDRSENSLSASNTVSLQSEYMTAIPCRFALHPYKIGHLACASSGGKVFLWTRA
ncbi:hypothetical protein PR202_gb23908 [Eleusine coracana subsp. coracana]|uniref:Uncharacterized protein n=1 Tax=Eleusine coracana subsp. coracana TaxID=191504 RepID=A0AAV5FJM1_ELECO|nr:hypothetical protein PR202_gb23908 [Eleusine coracana subsp. coracana]